MRLTLFFQERGSITFGKGGHRLRFSTEGEGDFGASADSSLKQGSVMWRVEEGEGQFAGGSGLMISKFTVSRVGEVVDHHSGVIYVR